MPASKVKGYYLILIQQLKQRGNTSENGMLRVCGSDPTQRV